MSLSDLVRDFFCGACEHSVVSQVNKVAGSYFCDVCRHYVVIKDLGADYVFVGKDKQGYDAYAKKRVRHV